MSKEEAKSRMIYNSSLISSGRILNFSKDNNWELQVGSKDPNLDIYSLKLITLWANIHSESPALGIGALLAATR